MNKRQLFAINSYCYARFGVITVNVCVVLNDIEMTAMRHKCNVTDVVNAFIDYNHSPAKQFGHEIVNDVVKSYLKSKAAKAIGDIYEEAVEEVRGKW